MKPWPEHIERLRQWTQWECRDIPVDLILAIIAHESGGRVGIEAAIKCRSAIIPIDSGEKKTVNKAMGLMQIIPSHVNAWNQNKNKSPKITYEDMTGQDERAARLQIRIGCSIFANYIHKLNKFDPLAFTGDTPGTATQDQLNLSLIAYAIGPGKAGGKAGLIPRLEKLKSMGRPLNIKELSKAFPKWGYSEKKKRWINRPIHYGKIVWENYNKHKTGSAGSAIVLVEKTKSLLPIVLIAGAFLLQHYPGLLEKIKV